MILVLAAAAVMGALTWLVGWWAVPLAACAVGAVRFREGGGGWYAALAAALAWGVLLAADAAAGSFGGVAHAVAGVTRLPGPVLVLITLAFPALLAWSAATLAAAARRLATRS